jgi:hydrogenase/urease accessory protein HupE
VVYFLALFLAGIVLGSCCVLFPQLQLSTILAVLLSLAFVAASVTAPQYFAYIFFGGFALYHGIVHMLEMTTPAAAMSYITGLFFSTWLLLLFGLILRQVVVTRKPQTETTS